METLRAFAGAVHQGTLQLEPPTRLDEFLEQMMQIPGIGPWTAHYVAMRGLGEPDAFPGSDLGVKQAWAKLDPGALVTPRQMERRAENWKPWRSYAAMHLWQSLPEQE
jgi:3-methyladenine DNA glycosylase/8-oxoguanine DNA glycosylase